MWEESLSDVKSIGKMYLENKENTTTLISRNKLNIMENISFKRFEEGVI